MQDVDEPTLMCLTQVFRDEEAYQEHQVAEHHRTWWRFPPNGETLAVISAIS